MFRFDLATLGEAAVPDAWSQHVAATARGFRVTGDPTGLEEIYLYCGTNRGIVAKDMRELLELLHADGVEVALSEFGVSSLLHHGLVPLPHTEFSDIYFLAMGDVAQVEAVDGRLTVELSNSYPWVVANSRNDGDPSDDTLLSLLTAATERQLASTNNEGFLMLSSGKDSVGVALSLAEGGFADVPCVTYSSGRDDPEPPVAADICRRLGLQHEIVELPKDPARVAATLTAFWENTARPGVDLSQIPYAMATATASSQTGAILDGGGNDSYMGYPVTGHDLAKSRFRIRGRRLATALARITPVDSGINYLARSRAAATLPGRTMRVVESRRLYPNAVDTSSFWYQASSETRHLDVLDLYGAVNERHTGPGGSMQKQRLAAQARNMAVALPWCDHEVADYYFNLPAENRYSLRPPKGKLLLRSMLLTYLDYDADAVGKHYFEFDGAAFVRSNMELFRSEVESCALWDEEGLSVIADWLGRLDDRPLLYHSLLTIFMVSGWYNHSRFVSNQPVAG